nr:putative integron gene cassette protein [uncultured bacterium]
MSEKIGKPAICYETGLDEAFLLGTRDELSAFAHSILRLLDAPSKSIDCYGVNTQSATNQTSLTHVMSEIGIDGIIIVENATERRILMNKIRVNNDEPPINWQRYEERS